MSLESAIAWIVAEPNYGFAAGSETGFLSMDPKASEDAWNIIRAAGKENEVFKQMKQRGMQAIRIAPLGELSVDHTIDELLANG